MGTPKESEITRKKLVDTAGRLFAMKGFKEVTVREIATASKTSLSAVNYHFQGKENLYEAVLKEACEISVFSEDEQARLLAMDPKEAVLLVSKRIFDEYIEDGSQSWQTLLVIREKARPGSIFFEIVEDFLKPQTDFLTKLFARVCGESEDSAKVQMGACMLVGMLELYGLQQELIERLFPSLEGESLKKDSVSRLIGELSIRAARTYKGGD